MLPSNLDYETETKVFKINRSTWLGVRAVVVVVAGTKLRIKWRSLFISLTFTKGFEKKK